MLTSSAILNAQLIFDSCFAWTCFGLSSIFAYSKKWIKKSDFFLFPKLNRPMKGRRYATIEETKAASKEELNKITKK